MPTTNYIYCDSCVFLAYFNEEAGRVEVLDQLFEDIRANPSLKLVTSVITITEVAFAANERTQTGNFRLRPDAVGRMEALWNDDLLVRFIEVHQAIARDARDLMRWGVGKGLRLRTADAIHLASARNAGVGEFFTYDNLKSYAPVVGYSIVGPYVLNPRLPLNFDEGNE